MAAAMTSAGIGVGVACRFKEAPLVVLSAATAGMVGGFAGKITAGAVFAEDGSVICRPGEPLGAFVAAYVAIELARLVAGRTRLDIILAPLVGYPLRFCCGHTCRPSHQPHDDTVRLPYHWEPNSSRFLWESS